MKITGLLCFCCVAMLLCESSAAQTKPVKPAAAPQANKFKLPKLYTGIGTKKDSIITANTTEAVALINQPLVVTDDKKGVYTISSYQCMYKRRAVTEDEETGKVSPITSNAIQRFSTTPLSEIWRKTIGEQLRSGEEISFFDIVVKDAQNRLMFAPAIKIVVK